MKNYSTVISIIQANRTIILLFLVKIVFLLYTILHCFSFTVVTIVYAGVAVTGFLMFGESTMSQFTLNLPQQYIPSKIAIWMTV
jgi:hypothetical protein